MNPFKFLLAQVRSFIPREGFYVGQVWAMIKCLLEFFFVLIFTL